ncbi:MAG: fused MFS/spermidine synthase [Pirellulaceae bacterium]
MTQLSREPRLESPITLPLLVLLFIGSGCAALIYEIVWFQLLQLVIGSSAISLGVLLGTFMGGMCLGSLGLARLVGNKHHPLRVYAFLELGIAVCGLAVILGLPAIDAIYSASATHGWLGIVLRCVVATVCLLPPTLLMGATLPAVARWVEATPHGVSWLGFFYCGNIAGAVCGCLLAGFYLLRVFDMATATYVAVAINVVVAIAGYVVANMTPYAAPSETRATQPAAGAARPLGVYLAIGLSGLGALGAEVIWTRLLSLLIGGTVYTFSIILAIFLVGLGLGSSVGAWLARGSNPRLALGICQLLLAAAIWWAAFQLTQSLPYWPIDPSLLKNPWHQFQLDILRCLWVILPAACLWGASFPLALAGVAQQGADPGRLVGGVYAANTVGAIVGALAFSIFLIGWIGTQHAQQLLILLAAVAALCALAPLLWSVRASTGRAAGGIALLLLALVAAGILAWWMPPTSGELIAHGRYLPKVRADDTMIVYHGEGMNSSVAVGMQGDLTRTFHVSGKVEASSLPHDMRLQRMLGHIPALVHPKPKSVLIVGCGAGVTAGSFVVHPDIERIVICELEPLIPQVVAKYFEVENYGVVNDKRVEVVYDDARHYILTTRENFDVITSDPIHPWVKGAAVLYTREYFDLCKRRLKPGGVITQWVPLYESNAAAVKSEVATFFEVFPEGSVWGNDQGGYGYDTVLLGQVDPLRIDVDELVKRLNREDHRPVVNSLKEVGLGSAVDLLSTFAGSANDLKPWLADAEINRDRNLRLQYLAGMGASDYSEAAIYREMLSHRTYPEKAFVASPAVTQELKKRFGLPTSTPNTPSPPDSP